MNFFMSLIEFAFLLTEAIWIIKCANLQMKNKRFIAFGFLAAIATSGFLQDKISEQSAPFNNKCKNCQKEAVF